MGFSFVAFASGFFRVQYLTNHFYGRVSIAEVEVV